MIHQRQESRVHPAPGASAYFPALLEGRSATTRYAGDDWGGKELDHAEDAITNATQYSDSVKVVLSIKGNRLLSAARATHRPNPKRR